jgi:Tfp pilus assembly protein PilP
LLPFKAFIYTFNDVQIPIGESNFKAFISQPNGGIDLKPSNDTLKANFIAQDNITNLKIIGDNKVCIESLNSSFWTIANGTYIWNVIGGSIIGSNNTQSIDVNWEKWGQKKIDLNVTNLCNSVDAQTFEITVIEQGFHIEFYTGENASTISWSLMDCDGNLAYLVNGLPSNSYYSESLSLPPGCYEFIINSQNSTIESFSLSNLCNTGILVSGNDFTGDYSEKVFLGDAESPVEFNLYPNPTSSNLTIEAAFNELYKDATFKIVNLSGCIVVPSHNLDERMMVEINYLPKGVYILEVTTPRGKFRGKIVKL